MQDLKVGCCIVLVKLTRTKAITCPLFQARKSQAVAGLGSRERSALGGILVGRSQ
ncbi:hypothetical protein GXM_09066 [Nostoc sphaeroides CCNUC1]|uniref:Uncharacterized protein n=1 Tax=Nostoc sphaeroides CCNUC1 TaxID=2653204 RepID=A0A5P8WGC2_9NOSO|nr:hypothetical protein GXM_09066 [Nostoc sphaeroides CCNUC1]